MQKVVEFLEKHVQWVAIGLGALFVLFMTWTYVLQPSAQVQIGDERLGPGEVDKYTLDNVGQQLETAMSERGQIQIEVPKPLESFRRTMAWADAPPMSFAGGWSSQTRDITLPAAPGTPGAPGSPAVAGTQQPGGVNGAPAAGGGGAQAGKIAALPVLPPPTPGDAKFGRSMVVKPGPDGQMPVVQVQAGMDSGLGVDQDWVTQIFNIDMDKLDAAYAKAGIPRPNPQQQQQQMDLYRAMFLQVEVEREELDADGKPVAGSATIVPPIGVWRTAGQPPPPLPAEGPAIRAEAGAYLQWASTNTPDILQPLFFTVEKGDTWTKPGEQIVVEAAFDPQQFLTGDVAHLTPEQRKLVMDARREAQRLKEEQKKANRPAPRAPGGRGPGGPGGMGPDIDRGMGEPSYAPAPQRPAPAAGPAAPRPSFAPAPAPRPMPGRAPVPMPGGYGPGPGYGMGPRFEGDYPSESMGPGGASVPTPAGLPTPGQDYPNGEFSPADPLWKGKQVEAWVHDINVKPEKTYRYRARYKMKNPIFGAGNVATDPKLSNLLSLVSEWSTWSSPVKIPPIVNFFVASSNPNAKTVWFDVFTWEKGATKYERFSVGPGDPVGGAKNGIDFSTGWTIVDFRTGGGGGGSDANQVLLVNDTGTIVTRSYAADRDDPLYKQLKAHIEAQKAAEGVAASNGAAPTVR